MGDDIEKLRCDGRDEPSSTPGLMASEIFGRDRQQTIRVTRQAATTSSLGRLAHPPPHQHDYAKSAGAKKHSRAPATPMYDNAATARLDDMMLRA